MSTSNGAVKPKNGNNKQKYVSKNIRLFDYVDKIKLWPSRTGLLHGIKEVSMNGEWIIMETHCGIEFKVRDSKNGRGLRQLKNRHGKHACKKCDVPRWKMAKYTK